MDSSPEFTLAEMVEMENIVKDIREESLFPEFCKGLASNFSLTSTLSDRPDISWKQVQSWFQDRLKQVEPRFDSIPEVPELCLDLAVATNPSFSPESSQRAKGKKPKPDEISELIFEARSSRDNAWYDVAAFLSYRINYYGELEVRVRFSGFGTSDDEWVNVKKAVRERSIPLEPSECHKANVGDLVLCFRERLNQAVHCDAHIVGIQRRSHDATVCTCIFLIRYDLDNTEEQAKLEMLCIRPAE